MGELKWYFPRSIEELRPLLKKEKVVLHGGGTGLLRGDITRYKGIIDLQYMGWKYIEESNGYVKIGAMETYNHVAKFFPENHLLNIALKDAATNPLRNRITIGGSIAYFPPWTCIGAPLLLLNAQLHIITLDQEKNIALKDYLLHRRDFKQSAIAYITVPRTHQKAYFFKAIRTRTDHPAFTFAITLKDNKVHGFLIGTTQRFIEFEFPASLEIEIPPYPFFNKPQFSAKYQQKLFEVELRRGIEKLLNKGE